MDFVAALSSTEGIVALVTLTFLEIVLGASNKLPKEQQARARNIGLILAGAFRVILLFGISYLIAMQDPFWTVHSKYFDAGFSGQSFQMLLYKSA